MSVITVIWFVWFTVMKAGGTWPLNKMVISDVAAWIDRRVTGERLKREVHTTWENSMCGGGRTLANLEDNMDSYGGKSKYTVQSIHTPYRRILEIANIGKITKWLHSIENN